MSNENTQTNNAPAPETLTLSMYDLPLFVGQVGGIQAIVTPADAENYTINWSSSNPSVASVSDGQVTAHALGTAVISAWIPGTGLSVSCNVEVLPFVPVDSITVTSERWDMYVGENLLLNAEVCPPNATNPVILWSSKNEEIATVDENSGMVHAHKDGSTVITATARYGAVEKTDTCIVIVNNRPPAKQISIVQDEVHLNQGETCQLQATVTPKDAVALWVSDNEAVAKVGLHTGEVQAISPGTARISAVSTDFNVSACVPVKVYKDTVTIEKIGDGGGSYTRVQFEKSGKEWRCVEFDMVNSELDGDIRDRAEYNLYDIEDNVKVFKSYSNDELRLLYAIDPHGVAYYVKWYAREYGGDYYGLNEKDRFFEILYNRKPKYYMRDAYGKWRVTSDTDDKSCVLSEAECIFGAQRAIQDFYHAATIANAFFELVIDIIDFGIDALTSMDIPVKMIVSAGVKALIGVPRSPMDVLTEFSESEFPTAGLEESLEEFMYENDTAWVSTLADLASMLIEFGQNISSAYEVKLPFINGMIDYCLSGVGYSVILKKDNNIQRVDDIQKLLNRDVEN